MEKLANGTPMHRIGRWRLFQHLGPWRDTKNSHQNTEWNLNAGAMTLYRHKEGMWSEHRAVNYGRLRFKSNGVSTAEPCHVTHKADGTQHRRQIELSELHAVHSHEPEGGHNPAESIYTSAMGECFHALSKYVRRLVGNIPDIVLPENLDCTEPTDLIVATNGSHRDHQRICLVQRGISQLDGLNEGHTLIITRRRARQWRNIVHDVI
jgi:hypothetical protein